MRAFARLAVAEALAASLSVSAAAAPEPPAPGPASQLVQVFVAGSSETVARTRVAVQELLARLELPTVVRDAAGADEALLNRPRSAAMVNAYLDLRSLDALRVVVADGTSGEVLESRVLPAAASTETAVEAAAHVLYMTVESAVRARDEGTRRSAEPAPAPEATTDEAVAGPSSSPEPATGISTGTSAEDASPPESGLPSSSGAPVWGLGIGIGGTAASFGPSRPLAGVRGGLDVAARALPVRPGLSVSFCVYAPGQVTGASGAGSVHAMELRVTPYVEWRVTARLSLHAGAGLGADFMRFDPERAPAGAVSLGSLRTTDLMVTSLVGAKMGLAHALSLVVGTGIDVDTNPRRYVAEYGPRREIVFELASIRPHAFVGLDWSFAGAPLFSGRSR